MVASTAPLMLAPKITPSRTWHPKDRLPGPVDPSLLDDRALLAAISVGDTAALDQFYVRHRTVAFAAAYALLHDASAAEDAVHDALLNVWSAAASFRPERGLPRAWLLTIVRNTAIDMLRTRRVVQRRQVVLAISEESSHSAEDVCAAVATAEEAKLLRAALETLPRPQRNAIELAFFAGLTHGEVAARTRVPLGTAKGRIRLGLRRLRHALHAPPLPAPAPGA